MYRCATWESTKSKLQHYRRREPEKSVLYQLCYHLRDTLALVWTERFQATYGVLRDEVLSTFDEYLNCGLLCHGAARVYCDTCQDAWTDLNVRKGRWMRVWTWLKGGYSNDGAIKYWELTDSGVQIRVDRSNFNTFYPQGTLLPSGQCGSNNPASATYRTVYLNAYGRATPPSHPTFDDFYLATGPNARARVEIGNQPSYTASTKLAILTTSSWTSSSITATMRQGIFRPGDTAYVFVFDANGNVSSASQAITLGGTTPVDTLAPSAPQNLGTSQ